MGARLVTVELFVYDEDHAALERAVAEMRAYQRASGEEPTWEAHDSLRTMLLGELYRLRRSQQSDDEHYAAMLRLANEQEAAQGGEVAVYEPEAVPEWLEDIQDRIARAKGLAAYARGE